MGKKTFVLIVALMTFSLIGIITVQIYWINNAIETKRKQFKNDVKIALAKVSEDINEKEFAEFERVIQPYLENSKNRSSTELRRIILQQIDTARKQRDSYSITLLEENIRIPNDYIESGSILLKKITGREDFFQSTGAEINIDFLENNSGKSFTRIRRFTDLEERIQKMALQQF